MLPAQATTGTCFIFKKGKCFLLLLLVSYTASFSQPARPSKKSVAEDPFPAKSVNIREHLKIFDDTSDQQAVYRISVCADVPDNKKPLKVAYQQETGHVFLVLQKIRQSNDTITRVFGFYPKRGLQTLLFKKVKSIIKDNSRREHDVAIYKEITAREFDTVIVKAIRLSERKYHMNRYNCYDYAILIFNAVAGESPLPLTHVRFPFIFGKGGSPCSIYRDFKKLQESGSVWKPFIYFGDMVAPISSGRGKQTIDETIANQ